MSKFAIESDNTIRISGHLDRDTLVKNWWDELSSEQKQHLKAKARCRFDLACVERADSAGLAWLINAMRDGKHHGVNVTLSAIPEKLLQLAKISDVETYLSVE